MSGSNCHIGIDMGGSKLHAGRVMGTTVLSDQKVQWDGHKLTVNEVLSSLYEITDPLIEAGAESVGIGVPGTVDLDTGTVYDLENIPDWKKVELKTILESRYNVPVFVNNDSNCFALGESVNYPSVSSLVAVTLGTGLGSGVVINGQLYPGRNCGAGEFGAMPYLEKTVEYYASGNFFKLYKTTGEELAKKAADGDPIAAHLFGEFGNHLGTAIKMILFALDPEVIVLGGSVSKSFQFFKSSMMAAISTFPFSNVRNNVNIQVSESGWSTLIGASKLHEVSAHSVKAV